MTARGVGEAAESIALEVLHGAMQAKDLKQQPWPGLGSLHCAQLQGQGMCPQCPTTVKAGDVCLALQRGMTLGPDIWLRHQALLLSCMPRRCQHTWAGPAICIQLLKS